MSILIASDFLPWFFSVRTNQAPSPPFPSLHSQVVSKWNDTSCLHWEHWTEMVSAVDLPFRDLVFNCLQSSWWHCLPTLNPKGHIPGWVHLKVVTVPGWYWMMSVWAPRVWWSERKVAMFRRLKMKWETAQSITNLCVVVGWKLGWEKPSTFSKRLLGHQH